MNAYQAACHGKKAFPSRRAARRRARQIRGTGGPDFTNYRCPWCGSVHLAHPRGQGTHLRTGYHGPIHVTQLPA